MARSPRVVKAQDEYTDGSVQQPIIDSSLNTWSMLSRDIGSTGIRQFGGFIREEFLPELRGRQLARTYREMLDNQAVIGSIIFAITQSMRSVRWRDVPANDSPKAKEYADFAASLRQDCSHTWEEHITEALSMIGYGFHLAELVYKKRDGRKSQTVDIASSKHNDGLIGWRRLPGRSQDVVLNWFFDKNGQMTGVRQLPWVGRLIDIPVQKLLLFRPAHYKNNPEGRSALRNAVRAHLYIKRLEEMEAILFERLSGLPVMRIPGKTITAATAGDKDAKAAYDNYVRIVNNIRINDQMGLVLPSDCWPGPNGPSTQKMFEFELVTPQAGHIVDPAVLINRYKLDILKSVLADFIDLGHQARGTQNLAITKIDMFYQAVEGWLRSLSAIHNRYAIPRIFELNGFDMDLCPTYEPDMVSRVDLNQLGSFVANLARSNIDMTDPGIENYLRTQAGMPQMSDDELDERKDQRDLEQPIQAVTSEDAAQQTAQAILQVVGRTLMRDRKAGARPPNVGSQKPKPGQGSAVRPRAGNQNRRQAA